MTLTMAPRANIVLHDPHADVRQSGCISALKILTSARGILDLIYAVWSTSFDISLLDSFCSVCSQSHFSLEWISSLMHLFSSAGLMEVGFSYDSSKRPSKRTALIRYPHFEGNLISSSSLFFFSRLTYGDKLLLRSGLLSANLGSAYLWLFVSQRC